MAVSAEPNGGGPVEDGTPADTAAEELAHGLDHAAGGATYLSAINAEFQAAFAADLSAMDPAAHAHLSYFLPADDSDPAAAETNWVRAGAEVFAAAAMTEFGRHHAGDAAGLLSQHFPQACKIVREWVETHYPRRDNQ